MEAKYTKGNWTLGNSELYPNGKGVFDEKGIAYVCQVSDICGKEEAEANAKLIMASPKMVDALLKVVQTYNIGSKVNGMPSMTLALGEAICNAETVLKEAME